jgi:hypothetical protein
MAALPGLELIALEPISWRNFFDLGDARHRPNANDGI